jgi:hypothetical protein
LIPACGSDGDDDPVSVAAGASFNRSSAFDNDVLALALAEGGSGDVYAGGDFTSYGGVAAGRFVRLNPDGTIDTAFSTGTGFNNSVYAVAAAGDGSGDVYVGGSFTSYNGTPCNRLVRLNADGSLDAAFALGTGFNGSVFCLLADGAGGVYAGGQFTTYKGGGSNRIIRIGSTGTADPAFAVGTGFNHWVLALAPAEGGSGDVYVGGRYSSYDGTPSGRIARLNSNGSIDAGFAVAGFDGDVVALTAANDLSGDVYVGGYFLNYGASPSRHLARLNDDGTLDAGFAVAAGFNHNVLSIVRAGSGDLYVGGDFTDYQGSTVDRIVRLDSNGLIDSSFNEGSGFDNDVLVLLLAGDGSGDVFAGGHFTEYDSSVTQRIARVMPSGDLQ